MTQVDVKNVQNVQNFVKFKIEVGFAFFNLIFHILVERGKNRERYVLCR